MTNSSPEQSRRSTYMSGQAAQEVQTGRVRVRESRSGSKEAATATTRADTKPHADRIAEPDIGRRRPTVSFAVIGILALLLAMVLIAVGSSETEPVAVHG